MRSCLRTAPAARSVRWLESLFGSGEIAGRSGPRWLSLAYVTVAGTVVAFVAVLKHPHRLGLSKAWKIDVMRPVVALAVAGNVLMLRR